MKPLVELTVPLPDVLEVEGGEYRVTGSRITLYDIVTAYDEHGVGPHAMVFYFPTLSLDQIERVLEFYHANQKEVRDFCRGYRAVLDQQRAAGRPLDSGALRERYEALKAAEINGTTRPTSDAPVSP